MINTWDTHFIRLARFWADECSKDPDTKVGAVLVGTNRRDVVLGYNGFPGGIADDERLGIRDLKRKFMQHAERNALDNARFECTGATMYVTEHPCLQCTLSIISKGVKRLVCPRPPAPLPEPTWRNDIHFATYGLREAEVQVDYWPQESPQKK